MPDIENRLRRAIQQAEVQAASSDFDLNPGHRPPEPRLLRPAAVLVAVTRDHNDQPSIVLTKRSSALRHHPGQIAFPGGKQDPGDPTLEAAALREAHEEVGLPYEQVKLLGRLPSHETLTAFTVTPVVAMIEGPFTARAEVGEVDEVFTVPLSHLLDLTKHRIEQRLWQGQLRNYYTVPWGPYYIWGATARILYTLAIGARA